jgi:hypothetical protein
MRRDFRDALRQQRGAHGLRGAAFFALGAYADVLWTGLQEHGALISRDFLYAARSVRKTPLFSFVVVATFAVAIGANATAFSILRGVVLAPLPYADASRLVSVTMKVQASPSGFSIRGSSI